MAENDQLQAVQDNNPQVNFEADFKIDLSALSDTFVSVAEECMRHERNKCIKEKEAIEEKLRGIEKKRYAMCTKQAKEQFKDDVAAVMPVILKYTDSKQLAPSYSASVGKTIVNDQETEEPTYKYFYDMKVSVTIEDTGSYVFGLTHTKPADQSLLDNIKEEKEVNDQLTDINKKIDALTANLTTSHMERLTRRCKGFVSSQFVQHNVKSVKQAYENMVKELDLSDYPYLQELFNDWTRKKA